MSETDSSALFHMLGERLRPSGRIVYWNLLVPRAATEKDSERLRPLREEAARYKAKERLYFYSALHIEETH